jgi:hypothetical protein
MLGRDRVLDQVGQELLFIQRALNANDLPVIGHPEEQMPAGGICNRHKRPQHRARGRQVAPLPG